MKICEKEKIIFSKTCYILKDNRWSEAEAMTGACRLCPDGQRWVNGAGTAGCTGGQRRSPGYVPPSLWSCDKLDTHIATTTAAITTATKRQKMKKWYR